MKKILSLIILFNLMMLPLCACANEPLPELPNLPDFDMVAPPDGLDAFSPSAAPPQIAPKKPQTTNVQTAKPTALQPANVAQPEPVKIQAKKTVPKQPQKTVKKPVSNPSVTQTPVNSANNSYYKNNLKSSYVVPKGKKFKVTLMTPVSSSTPKGARVSFRSLYPETSRYITIPAGTVFYGKVTDAHRPQITGNGGLIVIEVNQMVYKGKAYNVDAKVSVAHGKHIFFNNIKGKRMYFQSIPKALKPGTTYFKKMWRVTCRLARNDSGVEIILTPFSLLAGTLVYAVNFVSSPVLAIFYKGKSISIPANSQFTIQLREDAVLLR